MQISMGMGIGGPGTRKPPVMGTGDALQLEDNTVLLAEDDSELEEE